MALPLGSLPIQGHILLTLCEPDSNFAKEKEVTFHRQHHWAYLAARGLYCDRLRGCVWALWLILDSAVLLNGILLVGTRSRESHGDASHPLELEVIRATRNLSEQEAHHFVLLFLGRSCPLYDVECNFSLPKRHGLRI